MTALTEPKLPAGHIHRNWGRGLWSESGARLGQDRLWILPRRHKKTGQHTELVAAPGRAGQAAVQARELAGVRAGWVAGCCWRQEGDEQRMNSLTLTGLERHFIFITSL